MTFKLGILSTHPIQYQAPWFRALAEEPEIDLTVFFCMIPDAEQQGVGFGVAFQWDVPLRDGYRSRVLKNVARPPSLSSFSGCDTPEIAAVVRDEGFDAFVVNGWRVKSYIQLLRACRRFGVQCIVRGESNSLRQRPLWTRLIHRLLLRQFDGMLYIGEANRRFYRQNGVPAEKLFFAPYCVENDRFESVASALQAKRDEVRSSWGLASDAVVFLFCGKFVAMKRPMDCLTALEAATKTAAHSRVQLLMVGTGPLLAACKAEASRRDLPVTFAGFLNQSEMPRAYAAADCLVLPSDDGETWGLVVNEAMACGLPAVVSDRVGCHPDLVTAGETGYVFPLGDAAECGRILAELANEPERLKTMGRAAQVRVSRYNYNEVVRGTRSAITALGQSARHRSRSA